MTAYYRSFASLLQRVRCVMKRNYSDKKYSEIKKMIEDKSKFERDLRTPEDVLLYSFANKELKHTMIVLMGYTGLIVTFNSAHVIYLSWNTMKKDESTRNDWRISFGSSLIAKYAMISLLIIGGIGTVYLSNYYVGRVVKSITLLKGGQSVNIETYRPFHMSKNLKVDLKNVSAVWRSSESSSIEYLIRVKGENMSYSMDLRDGKIINKDLFYSTVGVKRSFR